VGDITSFPVKNGWLHLAVVLDLSTRRVLGWKVSRRMQTNLVQGAMEVAVSRGLVREGAIFHSDRGGQYIAQGYKDFCQSKEIRQSMGRTGVCWDNAVAESFFAT